MCNNYLGSHDSKIPLIRPFYKWTTLSVKNLMPLKPAKVAYSSQKSSLLSNVDQALLLSHITESQIHEVMVVDTSQSVNALTAEEINDYWEQAREYLFIYY